jgi:hypothetical protein
MESLLVDSGKFLLGQGLLGALVLVLGIVVFLLYRELRQSDQKRFEELEKIIAAREMTAGALNTNSIALEANNKAMEARTRATEEMSREVSELRRALETATQQGSFNDQMLKTQIETLLRRIDDYLRARGAQ